MIFQRRPQILNELFQKILKWKTLLKYLDCANCREQKEKKEKEESRKTQLRRNSILTNSIYLHAMHKQIWLITKIGVFEGKSTLHIEGVDHV